MKAKRNKRPLTPERIDAYRNYRPMSYIEQIAALRSFDGHRTLVAALGDLDLAAAAERAWVQDAVAFVANADATEDEARRRAAYLQTNIDSWVLLSATAPEHVACVDMIAAAIQRDAARWGFTVTSTRRSH